MVREAAVALDNLAEEAETVMMEATHQVTR
jgi:hypothetical protein